VWTVWAVCVLVTVGAVFAMKPVQLSATRLALILALQLVAVVVAVLRRELPGCALGACACPP
jgi:hypothetical protein